MRRLGEPAGGAAHHQFPRRAHGGQRAEHHPVRVDGADRCRSDDTLGALAERTGLDQSTLSRNLRALETSGLVEIAIIEGDQRRRAVWLTEEGARRLQAAIPVWRKAHAALAKRLDPRLALRLGAASEELPRELVVPPVVA